MKPNRISIAWLVAAVAVIAIDFAAIRAGLDSGRQSRIYTQQYLLLVPALEIAIERSIRVRAGSRHFWCGFAASCVLVASGQYWVATFQPPVISSLWVAYLRLVNKLIVESPRLNQFVFVPIVHFLTGAFTFFLPQLLLALIGGAATHSIGRRMTKRRTEELTAVEPGSSR